MTSELRDIHIQPIHLPSDQDILRQPVGKDWGSVRHLDLTNWKTLSFVRYKPTWIEPQLHATLISHPTSIASHLILLKSPDWKTTLVIYPISTLHINHNLEVKEGGVITSNVRRVIPSSSSSHAGNDKVWVMCGIARNRVEERRLVERVVRAARGVVGGREKGAVTGEEKRDSVWDALGICTWESFRSSDGTRARPTLDLLLSLVPTDFSIKSFLIDDGWQDVHTAPSPHPNSPPRGRMVSFNPYPDFGAPMSDVISQIKVKGVQKVGVWMTLQGYWFGLEPHSEMGKKYDVVEYKVGKGKIQRGGVADLGEEEGEGIWLPSVEKAGQFWTDWFGEMKGWGIDFVKVDNQAFHETPVGPGALHIHQALWSGMLDALSKTWGTEAVIMCMSHNERMLNGPGGLDFDRPGGDLLFRNSEDYALGYPECHTDHIHLNTYNTILTSHLSLIPDFDMFASSPSSLLPIYHGLLRSSSPGPVLLSDTPHVSSDIKLLDRLTAKTKSGDVKVVQAVRPGSALSGRWFWDNLKEGRDGPAIVAGTKYSDWGGIIGCWNSHDPRSGAIARDKIVYRDVEDLLDLSEDLTAGKYILYPIGLSRYAAAASLCDAKGGEVEIELGTHECEGVVVSKIWDVGKWKVAVLGMLDKFACFAGLSEISSTDDTITLHSTFATKELAILIMGDEIGKPKVRATVDGSEARAEARTISVGNDEGVVVSVEVGEERVQSESKAWEVVFRCE
ncbi:hypothetical protein IAR55_006314 [Kwoniella newhampshirensis]|uniref:Alpha-galactosidase n=1 Tax=Kwoniella newhampshirensis TaxID=1651941 RepID=A0AAW0YY19_9TREE